MRGGGEKKGKEGRATKEEEGGMREMNEGKVNKQRQNTRKKGNGRG